ncbi:MAG: sulfotransferase [Gammaproteobacteria bacterium]|nr:sulfotransferase [Gammaproteobacteria bacterium]
MRNDAPVIVTALGGSGTRMIAAVLAAHDVYMGECFNPALDNLWLHFLLFNRNPFEDSEKLRSTIDLFDRRMRSPGRWDDEAIAAVLRQRQRLIRNGVDIEAHRNLVLGCDSLLMRPSKIPVDLQGPWGFKYPPAYLYAPFLFDTFPGARMVFLARHPLDMAYSSNRNQLRRFGHWLGSEVQLTPRWQLKLWLKAYDHVTSLSKRYAVRCICFEALISRPVETFSSLFEFLGLNLDSSKLKIVRPQKSIGRYQTEPLSDFDQQDLDLVRNLGFSVGGDR